LSLILPTKSKTLLSSRTALLSIKILYLQAIYSQYPAILGEKCREMRFSALKKRMEVHSTKKSNRKKIS